MFTSAPSKIIDQIPLEDMSKYREDKKPIRESQHGFSKSKSCLLLAPVGANVSVAKERPTDVIYLDFWKSFDTVPRNILAIKLVWI